jgi:hypothetical protein
MESCLPCATNVGGDFMEHPDRVGPPRPLPALLLYPPPGMPWCGAVCGLSCISDRYRAISGGGAAADPALECVLEPSPVKRGPSFFARDRCSSSSTWGPFPATGYDPLMGGSKATAES